MRVDLTLRDAPVRHRREPLSFCMEGIVRGLCAVTAFPFQLAQYYFF